MQTLLRQFSVASAFTLLVILLVGNAILTSRRVSIQVEDQDWAVHSRQVLLELEQTEALLLDAETGQRGFLLTGDPKYLAPYDHAVTQIDGHIKTLSGLTTDNPAQQVNVTQLGSLVHQKLDEPAPPSRLRATAVPTKPKRSCSPIKDSS